MARSLAGVPTPSAMTEITSSPDLAGTGAAAFTTTWTDCPHTNCTFSLAATGLVFIIGHIAFAGQGGTSNYCEMRLARKAGGAYAESDTLTDVAAVGSATNAGLLYGSTTPYILETLGPNITFAVTFQYRMVGGAATTLNAATPTLNVFRIGGSTTPV
jgi:hypothetical protein